PRPLTPGPGVDELLHARHGAVTPRAERLFMRNPPAQSRDGSESVPGPGQAPGSEPLSLAADVFQRDLRRGKPAHAVDAAAGGGRRAAEDHAGGRRAVRDKRAPRARVELREVHRTAVQVAADEIAVVLLELARAERAAREYAIAETGCEALD